MATKGMAVFRSGGEDFTINDPNNADEFNSGKNYSKGRHVTYQGDIWRFRKHHAAGLWNNADVDRIRGVADTKSMVQGMDVIRPSKAWAYFYGFGFFNSSLAFDPTNDTVVTLRIPLNNPSFVILSHSSDFMSGISGTYRFTYELEDGTLSRENVTNFYCNAPQHTDGKYESTIRSYPGVSCVYVCVHYDKIDSIEVIVDDPVFNEPRSRKRPVGVIPLSYANTANALSFMSESYISMLTGYGSVTTLWKVVNAGDQLTDLRMLSGISYMGSYHSADDTIHVKITTPTFVCEKDGWVCLFDSVSAPLGFKYVPANRIKLYADDIIGIDPTLSNPYNGLQAVAFGTSLTYRSQTTGGYLNYLPSLSGMTVDNQGIGSSTIKRHGSDAGWILYAIRHYNGFANKNVCILEGFVNDFGYNYDQLGTWSDDTEDTVCGCVRKAINYIMGQNPNLTFFLVLDHYGKNYNNVDTSSTALNQNNQTQFEWWEEIAKVGESLGVHVIKQYGMSGISENTPQYLMDNIHPTALGALQSANSIWAEMRKVYPNAVT